MIGDFFVLAVLEFQAEINHVDLMLSVEGDELYARQSGLLM